MTTLQLIIKKAKALKAAAPKKYAKWTDYVKAASATIKTKKKATVSGVKKKAATKKIVKKAAPKKAAKKATSIHKDSKSHNVRINVVSGLNKGIVKRLSDIVDEIERREDVIADVMSRKKELIERNGAAWYPKWIKDAKKIVTSLKKQKREIKTLI